MAKEDIKQYEFTSEQSRSAAAENGRKGGLASAEAKRLRKSMREWAEIFGAMPMDVNLPKGEKMATDMDGAVVFAQYQKAIKDHNSKAAQFIADLKGEMVKRVEMQGAPVVVLPDSEVDTLNKLAK